MNSNQTVKKAISRKVLGILCRIGISVLTVILSLLIVVIGVCLAVFHGPSITARNLAIKSLDETSAMKWVPRLFLPGDTVDEVLSGGSDDTSGIDDPNKNENGSEYPVIGESVDVTLDIGIRLKLTLRANLTVREAEVSDELSSFSTSDIKGLSFTECCDRFLKAMIENGEINEESNNAVLIGSVCNDPEISEKLDSEIKAVINSNGMSIDVLSLYSLEKDKSIESESISLGMSYNRVKLCQLVSGKDTSLFYKLCSMNLTGILNYCSENGIDISKLVNGANLIEKDKHTEQYDEWADCPDGIRIIDIKGATYNAHLMIVKDPSRLYVGISSDKFSPNKPGIQIEKIVKRDNAVAALNAGYFVDGWYDGIKTFDGGVPYGSVVTGGKYIFENNTKFPGFVGFNSNHEMIVFDRFVTEKDIKDNDIVEGANCYPVFIKDGNVVQYGNKSEAESLNPRSAIGQRADGAIILLTIDGRMANSLGGTYKDIVDIMVEYGAVNAVNLDGGSSSTLYYHDTEGIRGKPGEYVFVNTRSDLYPTRTIPVFFMVKRSAED